LDEDEECDGESDEESVEESEELENKNVQEVPTSAPRTRDDHGKLRMKSTEDFILTIFALLEGKEGNTYQRFLRWMPCGKRFHLMDVEGSARRLSTLRAMQR
jgi:hypothetical protein